MMKRYIIIHYILFFGLCLFFGCKNKSTNLSTESDFYLTAKFNGEQKNFSDLMRFQGGGNDNRWQHILISGNEKVSSRTGKIPPSLDFELWRLKGNITPGKYTAATETFISRYAIQTTGGTQLYNTEGQKDFVLKITEISKEGIRGEFSGKISNSTSVIPVTEGSFHLPYNE